MKKNNKNEKIINKNETIYSKEVVRDRLVIL